MIQVSNNDLEDLARDFNNKLSFLLTKKIDALKINQNLESDIQENYKYYRIFLEYNKNNYTLVYGFKITLTNIKTKKMLFITPKKKILANLEVVYQIDEPGIRTYSNIINETLKVDEDKTTKEQLIDGLKRIPILKLANKLMIETQNFIFRV
jgi:hypothetical protein